MMRPEVTRDKSHLSRPSESLGITVRVSSVRAPGVRRADFLKFVATVAIAAVGANAETLRWFSQAPGPIAVPALPGLDAEVGGKAQQTLNVCRERVSGLS